MDNWDFTFLAALDEFVEYTKRGISKFKRFIIIWLPKVSESALSKILNSMVSRSKKCVTLMS